MGETIIGLIVVLGILIALFFILREANLWYWKIDEKITLSYKTNFLLEKISMQLGASDADEITVEEITTGKRKKVKIDKWIEYKLKNPKSVGFRTVKDDATVEEK